MRKQQHRISPTCCASIDRTMTPLPMLRMRAAP
jgi:hypothetical protein